jgi:nucleoside-diphosphate-sugar epimerase
MAERRIVLFGGSGFVGRRLASCLAEHGWAVRIASRHPRHLGPGEAGKRIEAVTADLRNEDQCGASAVVSGGRQEHGRWGRPEGRA